MTDTQAIAARLTAIAERLKERWLTPAMRSELREAVERCRTEKVTWQGFIVDTVEELLNEADLADSLSTHVETLTQQVAMVTETADNLRPLAEKYIPTLAKLAQAEQQRDTAHAALTEAQALVGYGGLAMIRRCMDCHTPYPDFSTSSHLRCWNCRDAAPAQETER